MRMSRSSAPVLALVALLSACAQPLPSPGGGYYFADGYGPDSSGVYPDGGEEPGVDVGSTEDAGSTDAAVMDTGSTDVGKTDIGIADTSKTDSLPTPSAMTVAGCPDGKFSETPPNLSASLKDAIAKFDPANGSKFVQEALAIRYPLGAKILQEGSAKPMGGGKTCVDVFFQAAQGKTPSGALGQASTLVHECGHVYDQALSQFGSHTYFVNESVKFTCTGLAYKGQNAGFARSRIKGDGFDATWPPCAKFGDQGCDGYAPIYLSGNPDDAQFDSGDQGYDMLLEEVNQYVNSLVTDYSFADQQQWSVSAEDGILTLAWYMEIGRAHV